MKKRIVCMQIPGISVLIALLTFSACGSDIVFHEPQPETWSVLTNFPEEFQGKWVNPAEESYILITQGEIYSFERTATVIPLDSLTKRGYLLQEDSLFQIQAPATPLSEEEESLVLADKTFISQLGDTILKEPDPEKKIVLIHYASGPKTFVHDDSTMITSRDDSLYIMKSKAEIICQVYNDVVIKSRGAYLFLNSPLPKWKGWITYVVHRTEDQCLRYTHFNDQVEVARDYFELTEVIDTTQEDPFYFASPTTEELMLFIASDSLEWEVVGCK